jgi:hypothetical protein
VSGHGDSFVVQMLDDARRSSMREVVNIPGPVNSEWFVKQKKTLGTTREPKGGIASNANGSVHGRHRACAIKVTNILGGTGQTILWKRALVKLLFGLITLESLNNTWTRRSACRIMR